MNKNVCLVYVILVIKYVIGEVLLLCFEINYCCIKFRFDYIIYGLVCVLLLFGNN